jgi:hypothetical protein
MTDEQLPLNLPGLEGVRENDSAMVKATRMTLEAWATSGKLLPHHAVLTQLMLSLAQAIDGGARSGRASAVAMAAQQLQSVVQLIDPPDETPGAGVEALRLLQQFMARLDATAGPTTVRGELES